MPANAPFSSATRRPFTKVPASQATARSSPCGWMSEALRLPSWMPPRAPSTTRSNPSAAIARCAPGRSADTARTATASLEDLIFGSPAATRDGRRGEVSLEVRKSRAPPARAWENVATPPVRLAMTLLLNIDVPDVETGVRFYTAAFDLKVGRRFGTDFVELLGWPAPVYLLAEKAGPVGGGGGLCA